MPSLDLKIINFPKTLGLSESAWDPRACPFTLAQTDSRREFVYKMIGCSKLWQNPSTLRLVAPLKSPMLIVVLKIAVLKIGV